MGKSALEASFRQSQIGQYMNSSDLKTGAKRIFFSFGDDNATLLAAGMAFYFLLSVFPLLGACVLIYGLVSSPVDIQNQIQSLEGVLPPDVSSFLIAHLERLSKQNATAGFGLLLSVSLAVWSGSKAAKAQMMALNVAYGEKETRSILKKTVTALGLTAASIAATLVALAVVVILPAILAFFSLSWLTASIIEIARWGLLIILFMTGLSVFYRFAPDRKPPEWKWVTPGAIVATGFWITMSIAFSWFVSNFGKFNETYGSFGAVIIFLFWLFITALLIVLGAEINEEVERQRRPGRHYE